MSKTSKKTPDDNNWSLVTAQANLKALNEEIIRLQAQLAKKSPGSKETFTLQLAGDMGCHLAYRKESGPLHQD